jgi:hypothetical protein
VITILDKSGKPRLVYSAPILYLPSGKTTTAPSSGTPPRTRSPSLSPTSPSLIAFGLGTKIPGVEGWYATLKKKRKKKTFHISSDPSLLSPLLQVRVFLPSIKFKFGAKEMRTRWRWMKRTNRILMMRSMRKADLGSVSEARLAERKRRKRK